MICHCLCPIKIMSVRRKKTQNNAKRCKRATRGYMVDTYWILIFNLLNSLYRYSMDTVGFFGQKIGFWAIKVGIWVGKGVFLDKALAGRSAFHIDQGSTKAVAIREHLFSYWRIQTIRIHHRGGGPWGAPTVAGRGAVGGIGNAFYPIPRPLSRHLYGGHPINQGRGANICGFSCNQFACAGIGRLFLVRFRYSFS